MTKSEPFVVRGRVSRDDGTPLFGVTVVAFDRDLRRRQRLGAATTDCHGHYAIAFGSADFLDAEKKLADLVVCVLDGDDVRLESDTLFNAPAQTTIDVQVPAALRVGASEYEAVVAELESLLGDVTHAELFDGDFVFLAAETDLPGERIAALAESARLVRELGEPAIDESPLYGLWRRGLDGGATALLEVPGHVIAAELTAAIDAQLIPSEVGKRISEIVAALESAAVSHLLNTSAPDHHASLSEALRASGIDEKTATAFVRARRTHDSREEMWSALAQDGIDVGELRLAVDVNELTAGQATVISRLQDERRQEKRGDWLHLAARTAGDWAELVEDLQIEPAESFAGSTAAYGAWIAVRVEDRYPTAVLTERIAAEPGLPLEHQDDTVRALRSASKLDLLTTPIRSHVAEHPEILAGVDDGVVAELETLQRLRRVAANAEETQVLLSAGYTSASAIAAVDDRVFIAEHEQQLSPAVAARVHREATYRAAAAEGLFMEAREVYAEPAPAVLAVAPIFRDEVPPEWREMFGAIDFCACEECRSVLGPAAYLVDQLEFIDRRAAGAGRPAREVLETRRPDLAHIELDCANSHTLVPMIDLVIELLERAVTGSGAPWPQTDAEPGSDEAARLLAEPAHLDPDAYTPLRDDVIYPWVLPFDLWVELARAYLDRLNVSRSQLLRHLGSDSDAAAAEALRLDPEQWGLIAGTTAHTPWTAWGYAGPTTDPETVAELLQRAGVDYAALAEWSDTDFVGELEISDRESCDTAQMRIDNLDEGLLDRLHRFARLQRQLGWSAPLLDAAITSLGGGALDEGLLRRLATAHRAMARFDWTPDDMVAFFGASRPAVIAQQREELAARLEVSVEELDALTAWSAIDPHAGPAELLDLAELLALMKLHALDAETLGTIIGEPDATGLDADEIASFLDELRRELLAAEPGAPRASLSATLLADSVAQSLSQVEELLSRYSDLGDAFVAESFVSSDLTVPVADAGPLAAVFTAFRRLHRLAFTARAMALTDAERPGWWSAADAGGALDLATWRTWAGTLDRGEPSPRERLLARLEGAGISEATAEAWARDTPDEAMVREIREAVEAQTLPEAWPEVGREIRDPVRERQAEALVAFVVSARRPAGVLPEAWRSPADLYAYYLIDVEMSACALTSRIKLAHGSVQLFVQRALMNLEPEVDADHEADGGWLQWQWRKNYRVWEAARRIFLHPENWLDPGLRDDKTPQFQALETALLQEEVTEPRSRSLVREYLEGLTEVAQLEVGAAALEQRGEDWITHVVARTRGTPPKFYYRREVAAPHGRHWTPWEDVNVDVDEAEFLMTVVWNGRLVLMWPQFVERNESSGISIEEGVEIPAPPPVIEMRLGWSSYKDGRWSEKRYFDPVTTVSSRAPNELRLAGGTEARDLIVRQSPAGPGVLFEMRVASPSSAPVVDYPEGRVHTLPQTVSRGTGLVTQGPGLRLFPDFMRDLLLHPNPGTDRREPRARFVLQYVAGAPTVGPRPLIVQDEDRSFWIGEWSGGWELPESIRSQVDALLEIPIFGWIAALAVLQDYYDRLDFEYRVRSFYHPFAADLLATLDREGLAAMLRRDLQRFPQAAFNRPVFDFRDHYAADVSRLHHVLPDESFEFDPASAYAQYNWEVFVHLNLRVAAALSQNQRFAEAQRWLHHVFDPTATGGSGGPERYWQAKPFFELIQRGYRARIEDRMRALAGGGDDSLEAEIARWERDPASPHRVARTRPLAYPKAVVMQYLDNLIAWADHLFTRDTIESINEATQLYLLAAEILGPRPQEVPASPPGRSETYDGLRARWDAFGNALVASAENLLAARKASYDWRLSNRVPYRPQLGGVLYFCIPKNPKLLAYWDTIADRLFKIRHCQDISGRVRSLALFEPPIDPALLERARRAGIDVRDALAGAPTRLGYRFAVVAARAVELIAEVQRLGGALLAALEKRDAEDLSSLSAHQSQLVLELVRDNRQRQVQEARATRRSLLRSRASADFRRQSYADREPLNAGEMAHLALLTQAILLEQVAGGLDLAANIIQLIPDFKVGAPFTLGALFGGSNLGPALRAFGAFTRSQGSVAGTSASMSVTLASYQRRQDDWDLQIGLAEREIEQLDAQITAAELRREIAVHELRVHDQQIDDARATAEALRDKYTNRALYDWMVSQLSAVYFQAYQLAYTMAVRAERAARFELGPAAPETGLIRPGYWDSLKSGLLAGDKLRHDLSRLQSYVLEHQRRELEITKHVSLAALDPAALVDLIETGEARFSIPEVIFDLDHPGHFLRRIKSVGVTIPAVTGPYVGVPCTLTLEGSRTRISDSVAGGYHPGGDTDPRFVRDRAGVQRIVTSTGVNDHGLFETNLRDERYLPFEGAGVVSDWQITLPTDYPPFDYRTISDVVLQVRHTARAGSDDLSGAARAAARASITAAAGAVADTPLGLVQFVSARREHTDEWHRFEQAFATGDPATLSLELTPDHFPHYVRGAELVGREVTVVALHVESGPAPSAELQAPGGVAAAIAWRPLPPAGDQRASSGTADVGTDFAVHGDWQLEVAAPSGDPPADVLLIVRYRVEN